MAKVCEECGKEIKEETDSPYCAKCDEKLDRQFETVEDNIIIYKELLPGEIDVLNKFEKEDIIDLYMRVYSKFKEEGDFTPEQVYVLNLVQKTFNITENEVGKEKIVEFKEGVQPRNIVRDTCPDCSKNIKEEFNFCPYCGCRVR